MSDPFELIRPMIRVDPDTLSSSMERVKKVVSSLLADKVTQLAPTFCIQCVNHKNLPPPGTTPTDYEELVVGVATDFTEPEEKQVVIRKIAKNLVREGLTPVLICLSSEAWISTQSREDEMIRPADDPNRKEAIIVTGMTMEPMLSFHMSMDITRDSNDVIIPGEWSGLQRADYCNLLKSIYQAYHEELGKKLFGNNKHNPRF